MTIDAPWFHVIPISQNRNGKYHAGKALSYITENNSTALKSSIDEGLDCNKKVQIRGYEQALVTIAAERNKYDCVKVLCEAGCNLSYLTRSDEQQSPLIWAIGHQNLEMVKIMVKHKVNLNEVSGYTRRTPLGVAVGDKKLDIVKTLVEAGAKMKINDASGKSLLSLACDNKFTNAEIIEYLLEKGCDPFTLDTNQGNGTCVQKLLLAPIYKSDVVRATEKLIGKMTEISPEETRKFLNLSTLRLDHPIGMMASKWKDTKEEIEIVKMLINAGANPQLRFGFENMSLMEMACTKNHINLAKLLICLGITIESPLDLLTKTLQKGHSKMFYLLTRTSQIILDNLHLLKPDGIENKIWQEVIEFRRNPLSLLELSRISIIGNPISDEIEELPRNLPDYIRLESD